ncbi:MAG: spore maturation protein [Erysipelotrichaceae bacterium]
MEVTKYIIPSIILVICILAIIKKIKAYSLFIEGAKEGLEMFQKVYPALLAMMFSIGLLRASGLLEIFSNIMSNTISFIPKDVWPMIIFRPLSGSASLAILIDIFKNCGVDSITGIMASVIQGSTDTTFYIITLYFGSIGIKKIRNALKIGLIADIAGISMAIFLTLTFISS